MPWTNALPAPHSGGSLWDPLPGPWRAYIGIVNATRRSAGAYSKLTPLFNRSHQSIAAFHADTSGLYFAPIAAIPPPQHSDGTDTVLQAFLHCQNALLQGVSEMLTNMATLWTLAKFHELHTRECTHTCKQQWSFCITV